MKKSLILACLFLLANVWLTAQTTHPWYVAKDKFILEKMKEPFPKAMNETLEHAKHEAEGLIEEKRLMEKLSRQYWSMVYEKNNKHSKPALFNKTTDGGADICFNGDFDEVPGNPLLTYTGATTTVLQQSGSDNCEYPNASWSPIGIPLAHHIEVVNANNDDPLVGPDLPQGVNGNAVRINSQLDDTDNCWYDAEVDRLVKEFMVTDQNAQFTIWFAFVLQNPTGHINQQPYFSMNVVAADGTVLEGHCFSADDLFFDEASPLCNTSRVVYRPWDCLAFDLRDHINETVRLEVTAADCAAGAHFGYAYIDEICEPCNGTAVGGSIALGSIPDCLGFPTTICGTYTLPTGGGTWGSPSITIEITSAGNNYTATIPAGDVTVLPNGTFCFDLDAADLLNDPNACYDIEATAVFTNQNNQTSTATSGAVVPGLDNDFCYYDIVCDTGCLQVTLGEIRCFDNGTSDPSDDYWNFDVYVSQGPGTFWRMSGAPIPEAGAYNQWKTIWMNSIAAYGSTATLLIWDNENPACSTTLVVPVPAPCSDSCNLAINVEVSRCHDNGTTILISDDYYYVTVDVTGTGGQCWMAKKKNADGTEELLPPGSFTGDQQVTFGPFNIQDGDWTLWIFICDQMDCIVDTYIQAPAFCSGCHKVKIGNVQCYDNGTSNPNDDYWTFDLFVDGGPGTYWTTMGDVTESGPYGQVKTIHMGQISQYGQNVHFTIFDNTMKSCQTEVILPVPKPCSDTCALQIGAIVGDCIYTGLTPVYYVKLFVSGTNGGCWMVKQKFDNGTEVILGTYYGDQTVGLGPFDPALGNWTLWVFPCESMDCVRDLFIDAPDCRRGGERSAAPDRSGYQLFPSPVLSELIIQNPDVKQDAGTEETSFVVFDILGKQVIRTTMPTAGSYRLNVEELNAGVYLLGVIRDGKVEFAGKFVKK